MPDLELEHQIYEHEDFRGRDDIFVAGCDEAGRGPFAGPLVAAAVILPRDISMPEITDSKKISKRLHKEYAKRVIENAVAVGVGIASVEYINRFGIGAANKYAIEEAVKDLSIQPNHVLIDGSSQQVIKSDIPQTQVVKGDTKSLSIAAASLVAKSIHDELMSLCAQEFPEYDWQNNAGYGTDGHRAAIERYGVCRHHRLTFKPIKEYLRLQDKK